MTRSIADQLAYDPETGVFTWKVAKRGTRAGSTAGRMRPDGYVRICVDQKLMYAHRVAWLLMTGSEPSETIDHINGDPSDNRWVNLRTATQGQNLINRASQKPHGMRGIAKSRGKWRAVISVGGKTKHLGVFSTKEAAHAAYCTASNELHAYFGRTA